MSYQQYFVVVATVIPVFFLAHIIQYKKFSKAEVKTWFLFLYGVAVLGSAVVGEAMALQYVFITGFPEYSTEQMPFPDESLSTAKGVLLLIVGVLIVFTLAPALAGEPQKKPAAMENAVVPDPAPPRPPTGGQPAGRTMMAVGLTALVTAALVIQGQRRQRRP